MLLFVIMSIWYNFTIVAAVFRHCYGVDGSIAVWIVGSGKTAAFMVPILSQICVRGRELMSQNAV